MWKIAIDLAVAVAAYLAAWRLQTDELTASAPAPGSALLIVVLLQVSGALLLRAYQAAPIVAVLRRFTLGVAAGSTAGAALLILVHGRHTVAATTLAADALLLVDRRTALAIGPCRLSPDPGASGDHGRDAARHVAGWRTPLAAARHQRSGTVSVARAKPCVP